ncbi:MAG: hypothetical protein EHM72_11770 [Calditrichaeota bacterium]|nr:MAG: hypothetical protein EHM72_11770 [Calditrichota bacterium]
MKSIYRLLVFLLFIQCFKSKPQPVQPDVAQFFQVYGTFLKLSQADSLGMHESSTLLDSALQLHQMSQAQFDTTLAYCEKNPDIFVSALEKFDVHFRQDSTRL